MPEHGSIQQVKSRSKDEVIRNEELIDNNITSALTLQTINTSVKQFNRRGVRVSD
jgi:hypothetical protein